MYEALTTAYSLVYSGAKSPYSRKWEIKDYLGAFGDKRELSELFVEVMKYDKQFCKPNLSSQILLEQQLIVIAGQRNRDDEDDVHLKKLFLERREGGGRRTQG